MDISVLDSEAISTHTGMDHEDVCTDTDAIFCTEEKSYINYYDPIKLEIDENDICVEVEEGYDLPEQEITMGVDPEDGNNMIIKSELGLQLKKEQTEDADNVTEIVVKEERDMQHEYDSENTLLEDPCGYDLEPMCYEKGSLPCHVIKTEDNSTTGYEGNIAMELPAGHKITKEITMPKILVRVCKTLKNKISVKRPAKTSTERSPEHRERKKALKNAASQELNISSSVFLKTKPKTSAERSRDYRSRKRARQNQESTDLTRIAVEVEVHQKQENSQPSTLPMKKIKTSTERCREFRARKKLLDTLHKYY